MDKDFKLYKEEKLKELKEKINTLKIHDTTYFYNFINSNCVIRNNLETLYTFYSFNDYKLTKMEDYYDVKCTDKLFSFSLFITNTQNLSYLIGLVYNYVIIKKHFKDYKMRVYIDFHSVFGSVESFNIFKLFIDILKNTDVEYEDNMQFIVFFLNPYYNVNNESIYENIVNDLDMVKDYYNELLFMTNIDKYIKSPLLNEVNIESNTNTTHMNANVEITNDTLDITYLKKDEISKKSSFSMFACHISVNLRFLPMNENCEFHVRDLDARLNQTDINIIKKFNNPKYEYVPYYVFQFYKYYFPYLKWRIDVNPYLAGCFGGNNKKKCMISDELTTNMKILKKELFFKHILFLSFNASNLHIGFLNDEFILADIFEKIKGPYSENILYLNIGAFANKHVNEYYYGLNENKAYPCILKLGVPIDILTYQLNGKYLTIDPITDFKINLIEPKYYNIIQNLITYNLRKYLGYSTTENENMNKVINTIKINYQNRLKEKITNDLDAALFFSMSPSMTYGSSSQNIISSTFNIFSSTYNAETSKLQSINFLYAGYLLYDILENIIFPINPKYVNSNTYITENNYDRLFNCLYFNESTKSFIQKKITQKDVNRKYSDKSIIYKIPNEYVEFNNKEKVIQDLNIEFNNYLKSCKYYYSFYDYIQQIKFYKYIKIDNVLLKTGILIFLKDYTSPIIDNNENIINNINELAVHTISFNMNNHNNYINGINISKNKLRFNLIYLDDTYLNQFIYHDVKNSNKVKISNIKHIHLNNVINELKKNKNKDLLIVKNI
jgi:hypothetical protein